MCGLASRSVAVQKRFSISFPLNRCTSSRKLRHRTCVFVSLHIHSCIRSLAYDVRELHDHNALPGDELNKVFAQIRAAFKMAKLATSAGECRFAPRPTGDATLCPAEGRSPARFICARKRQLRRRATSASSRCPAFRHWNNSSSALRVVAEASCPSTERPTAFDRTRTAYDVSDDAGEPVSRRRTLGASREVRC